MFEQLGIKPGRPWALATGAAEAFAGVSAILIAIALGLLVAGPGVASTHELLERRLEGRGPRKLWSRARPSLWLRLVKALK
jgi:hypothetical protein